MKSQTTIDGQRNRPIHPLFQRYTMAELERRTPYSAAYLQRIREGNEARPRFRRVVAKLLHQPEEALFLPAQQSHKKERQ